MISMSAPTPEIGSLISLVDALGKALVKEKAVKKDDVLAALKESTAPIRQKTDAVSKEQMRRVDELAALVGKW